MDRGELLMECIGLFILTSIVVLFFSGFFSLSLSCQHRFCLKQLAFQVKANRLESMSQFYDSHIIPSQSQILFQLSNSSSVFSQLPFTFYSNVRELGFKASGRARLSGSIWVNSHYGQQKMTLSVNTGKVNWE